MNYKETVDHLYEHLPMFSRIGPAAYKKDLHNTLLMCEALGNPQNKFRSVHIAGTNGKGSTSHMLAAVLQKAGYKTGLYTSPHLHEFRERIKINGEMVKEQFVVDFVEKTRDLSNKINPSFFELTVAMAFEYFAKEQTEIAIIETGVGGRLDSTNVITPVVSVITNIGYDHMNILGNSIEEIAAEKAGIIKENVPVVIGAYDKITKPIFNSKASACSAPVHFVQDEYFSSKINVDNRFIHCDITNTRYHTTESFKLDLNGLYQVKNLCTVLCTEGILMEKGFSISNDEEKSALARVKELTGLHGRWEVISEHPVVVLDVAHNEDGIRQILEHLRTINPGSQIHFVLGMVKDKEIDRVLAVLPKEASYYFSNAHIPRALKAEELKSRALRFGLNGDSHEDVNEAIRSAKKSSAADDIIIVCGSVFLVGEVANGNGL